VSPAGAAIATPLTPELELAYEVATGPNATPLTPLAVAYIRARNADPLCSFGDFVAVSDIVLILYCAVLCCDVLILYCAVLCSAHTGF
jgi:phosphoribosylaminoimidazolecarboxamide formyltransferase/IMP cyclohydrolase